MHRSASTIAAAAAIDATTNVAFSVLREGGCEYGVIVTGFEHPLWWG
jgi:hypothetical protein